MKKHQTFVAILIFVVFNLKLSMAQTSIERPEKWAKSVELRNFNNLYQLNDSIFRSEQPSVLGFKMLDSLGVKSVINLRNNFSDKTWADSARLKLFDVKMRARGIVDEDVVEAMKILMNAPKPVLVHCRWGADRTGVVIAMYRILFEGWTKKQAIKELTKGGYGFHVNYQNIPRYIKHVDIEKIRIALKSK